MIKNKMHEFFKWIRALITSILQPKWVGNSYEAPKWVGNSWEAPEWVGNTALKGRKASHAQRKVSRLGRFLSSKWLIYMMLDCLYIIYNHNINNRQNTPAHNWGETKSPRSRKAWKALRELKPLRGNLKPLRKLKTAGGPKPERRLSSFDKLGCVHRKTCQTGLVP